MIRAMGEFGITGERVEGLTGVWVGGEKIGALGVRVRRWITMHGFALNVNTDLSFFEGIIPCGITDRGVTSMEGVLGAEVDLEEVKSSCGRAFEEVFAR